MTLYLITFGNVEIILRLSDINNATEVYTAALEKTQSRRDALLILNAVDAGSFVQVAEHPQDTL